MTPQVVEVSIDRLTFEGFGRIDAAAVRAALEGGLTRLISDGGVPGIDSEQHGIRVALEWSGNGGGAELGGALAVSLYQGLRS